MASTPKSIVTSCTLVALASLSGCIAARQSPEDFGTIGGVAPLSALTNHAQLERAEPEAASPFNDGNVLDRSTWAPIVLLVPSDLTLHTPHYTPLRDPISGDWRHDGTLPTELSAHEYGSDTRLQLKSLACEPFLQVYDLVMMPVRMFTETPPNRLDASPDTAYIRAPEAWDGPLPITGRPTGPIGGVVISRPAESREL